MKTGIVIYSNDSETVWNAFRFANFTMAMEDEVKVFFIAKGVEWESLDTDTFKVTEHIQEFLKGGGKIFICGTCLEIHQLKAPEKITVATLNQLYEIVEQCDKIISF